MITVEFIILESKVGPAASMPLQFAALGFVYRRRLATTSNKALGRLGLPPPHPPLSDALGVCLADCRLATAGNEALGRWGLPPLHPCFPMRSGFVLQTARYREQRSAWQVTAAAPVPPLSIALSLSFRRQQSAWQVGAAAPTPTLTAALGFLVRVCVLCASKLG